jgi:DUF4097 and DUF4098 domain-containing protein YvlB
MNQKRLLQICACVIAVGIVLATVGFFTGANLSMTFGMNAVKTSGDAPQEIKKESLAAFESIDLSIRNGDIELIPSDHYGIVINYHGEADRFTCTDENGTLTVTDKNVQPIQIQIGFFQNNNDSVKIYLPKDTQIKNLKIKNRLGNFTAANFTSVVTNIDLSCGGLMLSDAACGKTDLTLSNGKSDLINVKTETLKYQNALGSCNFENVTVSGSEKTTIHASSGAVSMKNCTAGPTEITDSLGSVTLDGLNVPQLKSDLSSGSLKMNGCTVGNLEANNSLGSVDIQQLNSNGVNIKCSSGKIELEGTLKGNNTVYSNLGSVSVKTTLPQDQYKFKASSDLGEVTVNGSREGKNITQTGSAENTLEVTTDSGSVKLDFQR